MGCGMAKDLILPRRLLVAGVCLPVAVVVGYLLATPLDFTSYSLVGMLLIALSFPLLMRWHHSLLIVFWNTSVIVFFLPGQPLLGYVFAFVSLGIVFVNRAMRRGEPFIPVPSLSWSLIFLAVVVLVTAKMTGGIGGRALGSEMWGGKRYLGVFGAVAGYFAMIACRAAPERAKILALLFFLSGATAIMSDLAYAAGPRFYFLFAFFPTELAYQQAATQGALARYTGLTWAAMAGLYTMTLHYGIRNIFSFSRPWRLLAYSFLFVLSLLGGYRSTVILLGLLFVSQFYFEGLLRTKLFPVLGLATILTGALVIGFLDRMPLSVQRSLSFLPVEIDPSAKQDAIATLDWRLDMWKAVYPEVPRYLLRGKGYAYSGTDYYLTQEAVKRGMFTSYEDTLISGNYHNGLLTIVVPFGIWGIIGFFWFCWAAWRVLYRNYRYGAEDLRLLNTFLLSYFAGRLCFYLVFYGQFDLDFMVFTGVVGLSISLNRGVCGPEPAPAIPGTRLVPLPRPV
jgi:O-antigen ligase